MKLRVLNDLQIMQTKSPVSYVKLKRFDTVEAEYDGIANFLYEGINSSKSEVSIHGSIHLRFKT